MKTISFLLESISNSIPKEKYSVLGRLLSFFRGFSDVLTDTEWKDKVKQAKQMVEQGEVSPFKYQHR